MWRASLDVGCEQLARYCRLILAEELARASRFKFERDQRRFTVARGVLRALLASYTGQSIEQVEIRTSAHGKPFVDPGFGVHFNVSHSGEEAVFAIARAPVGIDIEAVRPINDITQLAGSVFSAVEIASLNCYAAHEQLAAFVRCWTIKEAFIKQKGLGLSFPLDSFTISFDAESPRLLHLDGYTNPEAAWAVANISTSPGYVGALVAEVPLHELKQKVWDHQIYVPCDISPPDAKSCIFH